MNIRALCVSALLLVGSLIVLAQQDQVVYDEDVTLVDSVEAPYPSLAKVTSAAGDVVVSVTLNDDGSVKKATPLSGNRILVMVATENAMKWRFKPNRQQRAVIVYEFRLTDKCTIVGESVFHVHPPNVASVSACIPPAVVDRVR